MQMSVVAFASKLIMAALATLLLFSHVPKRANANESLSQQATRAESTEDARVTSTFASGLIGGPNVFVNSDVVLDSNPIVGSFTVDGLTFAVIDDPYVELVGVASSVALSKDGETGDTNLVLPETVFYAGVSHIVSSVSAYAFYLSGIFSVTLPASISNVDDRAFRSSNVALVRVADDNPFYSSSDGALYDAEQLSLLLIPEGKQGTVRIPKTAEVAEASVFSHCPLVDSISVDAGSAAFASENGLLYTSDLTTLLRVPAGATEITIREGCTTIAAGALEACAKLATINAPASVASISPDVFHAVPTVSLPAASLTEDAPQLSAMVALSTAVDSSPEIDPSSIAINLSARDSYARWSAFGFAMGTTTTRDASEAALQTAYAYAAFNVGEHRWYTPAQPISLEIGRSNWYKYDADGNNIFAAHVSGKTDSVVKYGWLNDTTLKFFLADGSYYLSYPTGWSPNRGCAVVGDAHWTCPNLPQVDSGTLVISSECFDHQHPGFTIAWDAQGGDCDSVSVLVLYGRSVEAPLPQREGYTFNGWYASPHGEGYVCGDAYSGGNTGEVYQDAVFYAQYTPHTYTVSFDSQGGPSISSINAAFDEEIELPALVRRGYAFQGWKDELVGSVYAAGKTKNLTAVDKAVVKLTAQWSLVISATVPTDVEARVDVLGIEEQAPATGYIESRCGEPLKVAEVSMEPLSGATELFGAGNESQVQLQALAGQGAVWQPGGANASFAFSLGPLGSSVTEADPAKLAPLYMAQYGDRVPVSYRVDIPEALLATLTETTKPVCSVAYTVALAQA